MAPGNDDLPGFIEDDPKPAAKPARPAAPEPAFNAFADVKVQSSALAPTAPTPAESRPGTKRIAAAAAPAPVSSEAEADIVPGTAKDLWTCPHCSAKNKPTRETCRTCGKRPDDDVVVPWHANPMVKIAIVVAALLIVVLVITALMRTDMSLHEPGPEKIDGKPRIAGALSGRREISDKLAFIPHKRYAVSGRVLGAQALAGAENAWSVVLALGDFARDDEQFARITTPVWNGNEPTIDSDPQRTVARLLFPAGSTPKLDRGTWLSVTGATGELDDGASPLPGTEDGGAVMVEEWREK